jgi:hypothetical protein
MLLRETSRNDVETKESVTSILLEQMKHGKEYGMKADSNPNILWEPTYPELSDIESHLKLFSKSFFLKIVTILK